jgi:hypothetical protein
LLTLSTRRRRRKPYEHYYLENLQAPDDALGGLGGDSEAHQLRQLVVCEAMRVQAED